jgi:hypothetical protein
MSDKENGSVETVHAGVLSQWTNLSTERLRQIAKEGFIPKAVGGRYEKVAALKGLFKYYQTLSTRYVGASGQADERRRVARAAREEADARIQEQKAQKAAGELVFAKAVEKVWAARKAAVRQKLDQTPGLARSVKDELLEELAGAGAEDYLK